MPGWTSRRGAQWRRRRRGIAPPTEEATRLGSRQGKLLSCPPTLAPRPYLAGAQRLLVAQPHLGAAADGAHLR